MLHEEQHVPREGDNFVGNTKEKDKQLFGRSQALALILISLVFIAFIYALFTREKQKLDEEFEGIVTGSLNVHTQRNAAKISRMITDAKHAMQTAERMLR